MRRNRPNTCRLVSGPRSRSIASSIVLALFALAALAESARGQELPRSVQMHVHGSMSEGEGSMSGHTHEAVNASVDVVWWSDHDWRMTYHRHVSKFSFEAISESLDVGEPWSPTRAREAAALKGLILHRRSGFHLTAGGISSEQSYAGASSLLLEGFSSQPNFKSFLVRLGADRARQKRSLASDVHLGIAVLPEVVGPDARVGLELVLSQHPANAEVPGQTVYVLRYFLSNSGEPAYRTDQVYHVPVPFLEGQWNLLDLPVSQDVIAGFPFLDGRDNSLSLISFGVESRASGSVRAFFDDLTISEAISGNDLLAVQREMAEALELEVPSVTHHIGTEISYEIEHLNEFSAGTELHDWDQLAIDGGFIDPFTGWIDDLPAFREFAARTVVDRAHARGGVVSLNHTYGPDGDPYPGSLQEKVNDLLATRAFGVDILEVGYRERAARTLDDYLWTWDELAKNGLFLVGTGVSDTHGGPPGHWLSFDNNFVSWIYASSTELEDLLLGLKRGRVFFGDIGLFDGSMDIESDRGFRMGQIVVTDRTSVDLTLSASGLTPGDEARLVQYGQTIGSQSPQSGTLDWTGTLPIHGALGGFYRFEIYDSTQQAKAFSNPIYFVREVPEDGLRPERAAIDLGGVYSLGVTDVVLSGASMTDQATSVRLDLEGTATGGEVQLNIETIGAPSSVTFTGMVGTWGVEGSVLTLSGLEGEGAIEVLFPKPEA